MENIFNIVFVCVNLNLQWFLFQWSKRPFLVTFPKSRAIDIKISLSNLVVRIWLLSRLKYFSSSVSRNWKLAFSKVFVNLFILRIKPLKYIEASNQCYTLLRLIDAPYPGGELPEKKWRGRSSYLLASVRVLKSKIPTVSYRVILVPFRT